MLAALPRIESGLSSGRHAGASATSPAPFASRLTPRPPRRLLARLPLAARHLHLHTVARPSRRRVCLSPGRRAGASTSSPTPYAAAAVAASTTPAAGAASAGRTPPPPAAVGLGKATAAGRRRFFFRPVTSAWSPLLQDRLRRQRRRHGSAPRRCWQGCSHPSAPQPAARAQWWSRRRHGEGGRRWGGRRT